MSVSPDCRGTLFCLSKIKYPNKKTPPATYSFASAPHLGRLAQRALTSHTKRGLSRSLNGARRWSHLTLDSQAWQQGNKPTPGIWLFSPLCRADEVKIRQEFSAITCLNSATNHVVYGLSGWVWLTPALTSWGGVVKRHRGGIFFDYFLFAGEKKVISCRATPDTYYQRGSKGLKLSLEKKMCCYKYMEF